MSEILCVPENLHYIKFGKKNVFLFSRSFSLVLRVLMYHSHVSITYQLRSQVFKPENPGSRKVTRDLKERRNARRTVLTVHL